MGENDLGDMKKLVHMLHAILRERKELLQGGSYRQYVKTVKVLPAVILVIDNYAVLKERTEGSFESDLLELSRTGESYGIYLVITAAGFGAGDVTARMAENFRTTICLRMTDRYQYAGILRQLRVEVCPESDVYGRGLAWADGEILEFQTALALPETEDYTRMEQIRNVCQGLKEEWGSRSGARRVPQIPEPLTWRVLSEQAECNMADTDLLPVGYFTETAERCALHYADWFCLTVSGRRNTGKTNLLRLFIMEEAARGTKVHVIDSSEGKLRECREKEDIKIAGYYTEAEEIFDFYEQLGEIFQERHQKHSAFQKAGKQEDELYRTMCENQRWLIVIGDLSEWTNMHYVNHILKGAEALMYNLMEKGSLHNIYFAAAFRQEDYADAAGRRVFEAFTKYRTGIHMGGSVGEERVLDFSYVTYSEQDRSLAQGHGMLPQMGAGFSSGLGEIVVPIV